MKQQEKMGGEKKVGRENPFRNKVPEIISQHTRFICTKSTFVSINIMVSNLSSIKE